MIHWQPLDLTKMVVEEHRSIIERRHAGCILLLLKETVDKSTHEMYKQFAEEQASVLQ